MPIERTYRTTEFLMETGATMHDLEVMILTGVVRPYKLHDRGWRRFSEEDRARALAHIRACRGPKARPPVAGE